MLIRLEDAIRETTPEATMLITQAGGGGGGGGGGFGNQQTNRGNITVRLVPKDERQRIERADRHGPAAPAVRPARRGRSAPAPPAASRCACLAAAAATAAASRSRSAATTSTSRRGWPATSSRSSTPRPGIADSRLGRDEGRPELAVRVDRDKAAMLGMTVTGVAETIRTNVAGTQAAFFRESGNEYPIVVRLREEDREEVSSVGDVLLSIPGGRVLPAKNVMVVDRDTGPTQIDRKNQERILRVNAESEVTLSEAVANVQARLPELNMPRDFEVGFGNEVEEQARSFRELQLVLILAIILVYAVMASQYESLRDPFIIMFSIPLAAIGVVGILLLTRTPFSMQAYIGVIMLAGIVVSNAILLVDYANTLRRRDKLPLREAIEQAGQHRLRPILMTSICTTLGLVPMALGIGEGSELQVPLARVVIGGLVTSTLITLVFVPAMYTLFEEGIGGLLRAAATREAPAGTSDRLIADRVID